MFKPVNANENFPEMEKKWLKHWYEKNIVRKYLDKNKKSNKYFSFQDGPITANNPMGVHHAWGRTYKDLWPRFFNLLGYKQRFQNGFDCQGLWVEVEVEKELGLRTKKDIENLVPGDPKASIAKFVQLCKDRVMKFSKVQTEQSKRLGYFADWDNSYFTMSDANNYMIWNFLKKCYEHGWIYKGRESVPWCPRCETAISQHEMLTEDYKEIVHESVYFKLPITGKKNEYLLVWTTTPWTIPANIAVTVDEKFDYSLVETMDGGLFWVAKDLAKTVFDKDLKKIVKTVKGKQLVGLHYQGPFDELEAVKKVAEENKEKFHTVVATDELILPISLVEGTGLVHTAVSAGVEDFKLGKKYGLPMIPVIADNADYLPGLGFLSGKNAKKNPKIILDYLREKNFVFKTHHYKHRYPACWRCKSELVWKVEDEWYIAMDKNSKFEIRNSKLKNKTLRQRMIIVAKQIKWMPEFGLDRELDWLKNMHDWLISKKNRYWGLALPIYECKKCHHFEVLGSKEELEKRAVSGWKEFSGHSPHKPFIDEVKIKCSQCGEIVFRLNDVGNPWLDAGIVPYSTISSDNKSEPLYLTDKKKWKNWFPVDLITESFPGQFKNWFYSLIAMSSVMEGEPSFKTVLGFGTQLGEDGRPMHKSWGNAIEFNEGADKIGVDVMRWMFSRHNPADNMLFGYKKADEVRRQFYLMLWNVYKFFVEYANLDKWNQKLDTVFFDRLTPKGPQAIVSKKVPSLLSTKNILDKWILSRFTWLVGSVEQNLREFSANSAALEVEKFVSDLSTWFIRRSRDRVWVNSDDKGDKDNFYSTLHYILVNLSIIVSPFIPFVAEEIHSNLTDKESVNLENWPSFAKASEGKPEINEKLEKEMEIARKVVEVGQAERKKLGVKIRIPLAELKVTIDLKENLKLINEKILDVVLKELNVKNLIVNDKFHYPKEKVKVTKEQLKKEGKLRELIRQIQGERKLKSLKPDDKIDLIVPKEFEEESNFIKKRVLAKNIAYGDRVVIK
jgi:isoleucyl-tRNA synthetase